MAAVDYFLKIEGVDGESTDDKHKGEIDVESFSWGETLSPAGTTGGGAGGGAGKVAMQDFHFVMKVSKASPKLMLACASGQHLKQAVLTARKAGKDQQEFLRWTFADLLVTSYQTAGSEQGEAVPTDQISLNFAKIQVEYRPQGADGKLAPPVTAGWDLKASKKL
jgi:type VI secretion system secreted protein Hcp